MGLINSPNIVTSGLVAGYDAASLRSFRGTPATNLLTGVSYARSNNSSTLFTVSNNTVTMYVPEMGTRTVYTTYMYNDYNGGSSECCPNYFSYGTGISVSGSTLYTYSIVYKTASGYTHPNFMYRYEYNSGGSYLTEGGVFNDSNRRYLGEGWYHAWGQFTTQATTATLNTYLFYYRYALNDVIYIAGASLTQGSEIPQPQHFLNYSTTRGTTNATGGGWVDLSGNGNHGEVVNGPTYNSDKGGSIVLDGTNDTVTTPIPLTTLAALSNWTMECWVNIPAFPTAASPNGYGQTTRCGVLLGAAYYCGCALYWYGNGSGNACTMYGYIRGNDAYRTTGGYSMSTNTWYHFAFVNSRSDTTMKLYVNGTLHSSVAGPTQEYNSGLTGTAGNIGFSKAQVDGGGEAVYSNFNCRIGGARIYNIALSASEVAQNFNSLRDRYGV